jgi:predicted Na+-dependent transporter
MVETVPFLTFLETVGVLAILIFVLTSMLGMGFSLTVPQIPSPLHNVRLVILSLAANFILVPLLAIGILMVLPLSEGLSIGLFLLGTAAGATFLPKLARWQKGTLRLL